jgi:TonB family protein
MRYEGSQAETASGAELHEYTSWKHPYRNSNIRFRSELVNRLSQAALRAAKQGREVGGLLWGQTDANESVVAADATFVQGSTVQFNSTALDLRHLREAVNGWAPQASLSLIGYFRSHLREGLSLSTQDRAFIEQEMRDPELIFLVLKPFQAGICTAGFFFWHDGRLETADSELEVPFIATDRPAQPSGPSPQPNRASENEGAESLVSSLRQSAMRHAPALKAGPNPVTNAASGPNASIVTAIPGARRPFRSGIVGAFGLLIILIAAAGLYFIGPKLHPPPQPAPLKEPETGIHLQVEHGPEGELALTWNRDSPEIRKAATATLVVLDGPVTRTLNLDSEQLHSGKLIYFAKHPDVQFRLELDVDRLHTVAESIRAGVPEAARPRVAGGQHAHRVARRAAGAVLPGDEPDTAHKAQVMKQRPVLAGAEPSAVTLPLVRPVLPARELVTGAAPSSSLDPAVGGTYVPPRAIQEIMPETTPLGRFAQILVQVNIDEAGRVISAHAAGGTAVVDDELTNLAVTAAKRWRFQPATLDGKPIPAEYTIVFAFHPSVPGAKP